MQVQLRSHVDLSPKVAWDSSAYFVGRLEFSEVLSCTRLDTGVLRRWGEHAWLEVVRQNLLRVRHLEFIDENGASLATLIKRSAYGKIRWHY